MSRNNINKWGDRLFTGTNSRLRPGVGWGGAQTHVQKFYFKFSIILKGIDMEDFSRAKMSQIKGKGILSNFGTTNDYALF